MQKYRNPGKKNRQSPDKEIYLNKRAKALQVNMPSLEYTKLLNKGDIVAGTVEFDSICHSNLFISVDDLPAGLKRKVLKTLKLWTSEDEEKHQLVNKDRIEAMRKFHWKNKQKPTS